MTRFIQPLRFFLAGFPFLSLFFFPWPMTLIFGVAAGFVFPPLALVVGVLSDVLYHSGGWYWGVTVGLAGTVIAYLVRHFISTRII